MVADSMPFYFVLALYGTIFCVSVALIVVCVIVNVCSRFKASRRRKRIRLVK
jgi:Flp pilus assembly protein TadB